MLFRTTLTIALALAPASLLAQSAPQPIGVSDADALAEQVRRLGANPLDLDALLTAAELSLRLDDLSAAGAFVARAEKIGSAGARGLAVKGAILVRSERPGEALRQFALAEAGGLSPERFAADRGFAYDLTGDQPRAQRDYRLALAHGGDDETRRRLALSLGIAGRQREALDELAPLLRRNDRAAWRTRAFVLAMGGDAAEAARIASTMMPPGSAQGLKAFFDELPKLSAVDRAFAVHFGEVRPAPGRLADARLAPQLAALPAAPVPVQVAAVVALPAPVDGKAKRKKEKLAAGRVAITYVPTPQPVPVAADIPSQPPAYQPPVYSPPSYQPPVRSPVVAANTADRPLTPGEQASLAAATLRPSARRGRRSAAAVTVATTTMPAPSPAERASLAAAGETSTDRRAVQIAAVAPAARSTPPSSPTSVATPPVAGPPTQTAPPRTSSLAAVSTAPITRTDRTVASSVPAAVVAAPVVIASSAVVTTAPATTPAATTVVPAPSPVASPGVASPGADAIGPTLAASPSAVAVTATPLAPLVTPPPPASIPTQPAPRPVRSGRTKADDILARIVANLSIPASELGVAGGKPLRGANKSAGEQTVAERKADAKQALADRKAEAKKALADRQAAAEKKALAAEAAAEKKAERAEPARIWVQVAGGANERDLAKAWKSAQTKAPAAFAGRRGYTTPLRATNRVLTGPFKTDADARAYVNQLAKSGISAFSFTSDAGQKISRLGEK